jgi:hypothetical protein
MRPETVQAGVPVGSVDGQVPQLHSAEREQLQLWVPYAQVRGYFPSSQAPEGSAVGHTSPASTPLEVEALPLEEEAPLDDLPLSAPLEEADPLEAAPVVPLELAPPVVPLELAPPVVPPELAPPPVVEPVLALPLLPPVVVEELPPLPSLDPLLVVPPPFPSPPASEAPSGTSVTPSTAVHAADKAAATATIPNVDAFPLVIKSLLRWRFRNLSQSVKPAPLGWSLYFSRRSSDMPSRN